MSGRYCERIFGSDFGIKIPSCHSLCLRQTPVELKLRRYEPTVMMSVAANNPTLLSVSIAKTDQVDIWEVYQIWGQR